MLQVVLMVGCVTFVLSGISDVRLPISTYRLMPGCVTFAVFGIGCALGDSAILYIAALVYNGCVTLALLRYRTCALYAVFYHAVGRVTFAKWHRLCTGRKQWIAWSNLHYGCVTFAMFGIGCAPFVSQWTGSFGGHWLRHLCLGYRLCACLVICLSVASARWSVS